MGEPIRITPIVSQKPSAAIAHETTPHEQTEAQVQFLQPFGA